MITNLISPILITQIFFIAATFHVCSSSADVNVIRLDNSSVLLKGDANSLIFRSVWLGTGSTTTTLWMEKQTWLRNQQDWHSPGFGEASMRNFLNSALSQGIKLSKTATSSTDITPRVDICMNDAGRLLVYCFSGPAVSAPEPVTCNFSVPTTIDFGTVSVEYINNQRRSVVGTINCDKSASVKLTFRYLDGYDINNIAPGVSAKLRIGSSTGSIGVIRSVSGGIPSNSDFNVTLTSVGVITPGEYRQSAIVNMTVQ